MDALAFATAFMAVVLGLVYRRDLTEAWHWWKSRSERDALQPQMSDSLQSFRAQFEAANPEGPPMTPEEAAELDAWAAAQVRPAARLTPAPAPAVPDGCRLGGPVWLGEGQAWPLSPQGNRMMFLAQIDFATLPPLAGFPASGVAQVFLPVDDDLMGIGLDEPGESSIVVLARPNGAGSVWFANLPETEEDCSPFNPGSARSEGIPLTPTPFIAAIDPGQWQVAAKLDGRYGRAGFAEWEEVLHDAAEARPPSHHVGGYPVFVQSDFREAGKLDDYDMCLLHLTSDKYLQWGDVGEANLLIRSTDLARGDFSRVIFWWDCS